MLAPCLFILWLIGGFLKTISGTVIFDTYIAHYSTAFYLMALLPMDSRVPVSWQLTVVFIEALASILVSSPKFLEALRPLQSTSTSAKRLSQGFRLFLHFCGCPTETLQLPTPQNA